MELKRGVFICERVAEEPEFWVYYEGADSGSIGAFLFVNIKDLPDLINILQDAEAKEYNK